MLRRETTTWRCGEHELSLNRPRIMGILNVTPDSFSDGGDYLDTDAAIERGMQMLDEGADIIDVGGESTRPGFSAVSAKEEAERIAPVVRALAEAGAIVSVDTRHADTAKLCVRLGASIINDVTGFTDKSMAELATQSEIGCIIMHAGLEEHSVPRRRVVLDSSPESYKASQQESTSEEESAAGDAEARAGELSDGHSTGDVGASAVERTADPTDEATHDQLAEMMQRSDRGSSVLGVGSSAGSRRLTLPDSGPIMRQVMGFLADRARSLMRSGVDQRRICVDPGVGFGKTADEDVVVLRATAQIASMGYPVMCAVSRKRIAGELSATTLEERDAASVGIMLAALEAGARIVRVHDVARAAQALNTYWNIAHPLPRRTFVALGSNVGNRNANLLRAIHLIDEIPLTTVVAVSNVYESEPAYGIATPVCNCVIELRSELAPLVLMDALLDVEKQLGRRRDSPSSKNGPRTIDCDLLWMEGEIHAGRKLKLPHPGLGERHFVLDPLQDLQGDAVRFLTHHGVVVAPEEERVGAIRCDLGELAWQ